MFNLPLALAFANKGFQVFPLFKSPGTERAWIEPKGWNRFKDGLPADGRVEPAKGEQPATTDEGTISRWADLPNVVGYGLCAPHHIVFDLDVKNGKDGIAQFTRMKTKYGLPGPALAVRTKSGGMHLYYSRDEDFVTAKVGKATDLVVDDIEYPGIDLIANSGYVVGPYGTSEDREWSLGSYLIVKGSPADRLPACPVAVYRTQIRSGTETRLVGKPTSADELITNTWQDADDEMMALIRVGKVPAKIPPGKRDSMLTSFIGVLKARRLPKETVKILCEKFLANCDLAAGETKESFLNSIALDSKLSRFYSIQGDASDPRVIARELIDVAKTFKLVEQLHGSLALVAMEDNQYLSRRVVYTETKARQDLSPYARPIPGSDSKRPINPFDLIIRDASMPKAHSVGYKPSLSLTYVDPADGNERVNMYVPPVIPIGASQRSKITDQFKDLVLEICGDMSEFYLDFMAHLVQKPHIKMGNALLIISQVQGSGKNTLVQVMKPMIGPTNYLPVSGLGPLVEDKSILLQGNVLVVFNEVSRPANRNAWTDMAKAINKIKTAITESSTQINPKYEKQRTITTYSNFVMLSNHISPFDLEIGDRRIAVINNNPPKLDQGRFGLLADFAHNEKNSRLGPRQYDDMVFEFHELFLSHKISHNVTTGDAPLNQAKKDMIGSLQSPIAQALKTYREEKGPGATADVTCEDKLLFLVRFVLGFKDFGRNRERYDIYEQFVDHGILTKIHRISDPGRGRVLDGLPHMRDREDFPLLSRPAVSRVPQRIFSWSDAGMRFDMLPNSTIRDAVWADVKDLMDNRKGASELMSLVK